MSTDSLTQHLIDIARIEQQKVVNAKCITCGKNPAISAGYCWVCIDEMDEKPESEVDNDTQ